MEAKQGAALAIAAAGGIVLVIALTRRGAAQPLPPEDGGKCMLLDPDKRYYFNYYGTRKLLPEALGDCWDVIYYLEYWDSDLGEWEQPVDPTNYYLEPGTQYAIRVQGQCKLCGFTYVGKD